MASKVTSIIAVDKALLEAMVDDTGAVRFGSVAETPLTVDAWVKGYAADSPPAAHISLPDFKIAPGDTASDISEDFTLRVSVIQPFVSLSWTELLALRDAVIDAVVKQSNLDKGGYAVTSDIADFKLDKAEGQYALWHVDFTVETTWQRSGA